MPALALPPRTWTYADLEAMLDEEVDARCFEIIDGALVVTPTAGFRHEFTCAELSALLVAAGRPDYVVVGQLAADIDPSYLVPDLMVVPVALFEAAPNPVAAADVRLAVEVVSPGSRTKDRITKPALYAAAGVRAFWRIEREPEVTLTAYELAPGASAYTEVRTWRGGETVRADLPFPVAIPIDRIARPAPRS